MHYFFQGSLGGRKGKHNSLSSSSHNQLGFFFHLALKLNFMYKGRESAEK